MRSSDRAPNLDRATVEGFGREWAAFDQSRAPDTELDELFEQYFRIFPWGELPPEAEGFDLGCGSGRWAARVAPRVGTLHCIDASEDALDVARRTLADAPGCRFHHATAETAPLGTGTMDFGYALGVLHHVPDPAAALRACAALLKPGAPLLVYVYYAFDNRPAWYRALWRASDLTRRLVSRAPHGVKLAVSAIVAVGVYWPLARLARLAGPRMRNLPLSFYARRSLYTMRTDAYDRLSTRVERRFSRGQIEAMMAGAGLERIAFSESPPYWCAIGLRT